MSKIQKVCCCCQNPFETYIAWVKKGGGKFCSRKCAYKWRSQNNRGEKASNWRGGALDAACKNCGKSFSATRAEIKQGGGKLCSNECRREWRSKIGQGGGNPNWHGGKVVQLCLFCGKVFLLDPKEKEKRKFCSRSCMGKWYSVNRVGQNSPTWHGGLSYLPYSPAFNEHLKEWVRERDGRRCQLCEISEKENGKKLSVHHIDYIKSNCEPSNLISLCHGCHVKTNFERAEWSLLFTKTKSINRAN